MFVAPAYRPQFEKGYGPLRLNKPVMEYQISNWLLQDVFDCVDRILFKSNIGAREKEWAHDLTISIPAKNEIPFLLRCVISTSLQTTRLLPTSRLVISNPCRA